MEYLGKLIAYERKKRKITLERLSSGVLTHTGLKRLEDGERIPSFFVLERIVERLGISVNKLEYLLHEKDYEIYYMRGMIEQAVEKGKIEEACQAISYYETLTVAKEPVHYQYLCKMKAVISLAKGNINRSLELLDEALKTTLIWWGKNSMGGEFSLENIMVNYPVGQEEISLILLWLQKMWETGKEISVDGKSLLSFLADYYGEDEEEKAVLISKVCWVLGNYYIAREEFKEAYYFTVEGQRVLSETRILLNMPRYLDRLVLLEKQVKTGNQGEWKKQRDILKEVLLSYGKEWEAGEIYLWKNFKLQEVFLFSEVAEQERMVRKMSQQKIALELEMDPKTISRLEGGIFKPKRETFQKIKDYYEIIRDVCSTRLVTGNFQMLEIEKRVGVLEHLNQMKEAENQYKILKENLDLKWQINRQYVLYKDTLFDHQMGRIGHEEAVEGCRRAFRVTRPYLEPEMVDKIVLSRTESMVINYMGICYRKMGRRDKTILLLEKAIRGYEGRKVNTGHYYHSLGLLYLNLVDNYEENDQFEESILLCEKTIRYEISCNKCSNLGYLISQKQYTMDRRDGRISKESKEVYQKSYQLMKLMKREVLMSELQEVYRKLYGENII